MTKLLYSTFSNKEEAVSIAHRLLAEKLIACANIIDGSTSVYNWQGETKEQNEAVLIAKTSAAQTQKAIDRIKELHSYEVPCILILPIDSGFPPFMEWVKEETSIPSS
jgi:periplasmic divalent cation tolerance protein